MTTIEKKYTYEDTLDALPRIEAMLKALAADPSVIGYVVRPLNEREMIIIAEVRVNG